MYFGRNGQEYKKGNTLLFMIRVQKLIFYLQVLISKVKVKLNNPPPPKKKTSTGQLGSAAREGNGTPFQYSCLENPMDGGVWWAAVPGVARSRTWLSDFTFPFHFNALEKEMATHSSVLAWRNPGMGEPGGLLSMGSHRVGRNWSDLAASETKKLFELPTMSGHSCQIIIILIIFA